MKDSAAARKTLSDRGASLTYALLLFMTCAAVGIVALAAGSAAAGRLSELAVMDSRYYAVSSAASLLAELFDGASVTVTKTVSQVMDEDDRPTGEPSYSYSISDAPQICKDTASYFVYGMDSLLLLNEDEYLPPASGVYRPDFEITVKDHAGNDVILEERNSVILKTDIVETIQASGDSSGDLQIAVKGISGDSSGQEFVLTLVFGVIKDVTSYEEDIPNAGGGYTRTEVTNAKITWSLKEIRR